MNIINKSDFFAAITGQPVVWECPGVGTVKVRGLSVIESQTLNQNGSGDGVAMMLESIIYGLVEPKLDREDLEKLQNALPGVITALGEKILILSGLRDSEELQKKVGSGS